VSTNTSIANNNCSGNGENGIAVESGCQKSSIVSNICDGNSKVGIRFTSSADLSIKSNHCDSNTYQGIAGESNAPRVHLIGNTVSNNARTGLSIYNGCHNALIEGNVAIDNDSGNTNTYAGILVTTNCDDVLVTGNLCYVTVAGTKQTYGIVVEAATSERVVVKNNQVTQGGRNGNILNGGTDTTIGENGGYVASGELRSASGSLTAGNANAIGFAWHNTEVQDIIIKKVVIEVTTGGGTVGSHLDVGIADDVAGTNRGVEFFDDLLLNDVDVNDSWVAGDGGVQTKWVFCQDTVSATDGWIVGQILDANAASLVGKYYIEYVGR
jgi:hypothetical protein